MRTLIIAGAAAVCSLPAVAHGQTSAVVGIVYDSLRSAPLGRAVVVATPVNIARDTAFHSAITDDKGRFRIAGLSEGRYDISVDHASMDSIGVHVPPTTLDVRATSTEQSVALATPSASTVRRLLCNAGSTTSDGAMVGVVRTVEGAPVAGARVVFNWAEFDLDRKTLRVANRTEGTVATTNEFGIYRQCNLPVARSLYVQAQMPGAAQSGIVEENIGDAQVLVRDFRVAAAPNMSAVNTEGSASARANTGLAIVGSVVDVDNKPIANAQVSMPSLERAVTSNERGEFRLTGISAGTQAVEVIALGFQPRSISLELERNSPPLRVTMERTAVVLDSMQVIATRTLKNADLGHREFEERSKHRFGSFLTREKLDSIRPAFLVDAIRRLGNGVKVYLPQGGRSYVIAMRGLLHAGQPCAMQAFLNGAPIDQQALLDIPPSEVYGIEAFPVATSPPKYGVKWCGGLFVWTR